MEEIAGMSSLTVRIAPEARKILDRVANSLVYDEKDRLPLGRIVTAMVKFLEEDECWDAITKIIRADFAREAHERLVRDRERKRPNGTARVIRRRGKTEIEKVAPRQAGGISRGEVGKVSRTLTKGGKQPSEEAMKKVPLNARRELNRVRKARIRNVTLEPRHGRQLEARESKTETDDVRTGPTSRLKQLRKLAKALSLAIPDKLNISEGDAVAQIEDIIRRAAKTLAVPNSEYARRLALRYGIVFRWPLENCFGYYEENNQYCARCFDRPKCAEKVRAADAAIGVSPHPADWEL